LSARAVQSAAGLIHRRLLDGQAEDHRNSCKGKGYVMLSKEECDAAKKKNEAEKKS
jgi:hypothetical protein